MMMPVVRRNDGTLMEGKSEGSGAIGPFFGKAGGIRRPFHFYI
jgi:hypothetical protein